ncbi:hypothetical protein PLICRDRAFT_177861 [Plicaturopsis crispa FD-325 SS-3]|nr:hypothetical protein PLICRDRAFT_177861 [Plicaturopsis crispa FD-325 SS-3]
MDHEASELAAYLVKRLETTPVTSRILVGVAGIPASGKSTLAELIVKHTNALLHPAASGEGDVSVEKPAATLVGLDGWHLTRAQLDAFPDPKLAHDRRGIHWTFDGPAYVEFVRTLRQDVTSSSATVTAPSFDHALKDPTPHAVSILPHHRIVVIEGLYAFLAIEPWCQAGRILDERWWVDVDIDEAERRLVKRHVVTGVTKDLASAKLRAEQNDMPNGRFIIANLLEPTKKIESKEDPVFSTS